LFSKKARGGMRIDVLNQVAASVNGFQNLRPSKGYDYQNYRRRQIFESLTQGVQYICNNAVEGDVAEFGTMTGFSALTIAHAMRIYSAMYAEYMRLHQVPRKTLMLFDSFRGLPHPDHPTDQQSPNVKSSRWQEGTFAGLTKEELLALCSQAYAGDSIRIVDGWYSESLAGIAPDTRFAMVHLDCDLYSSTAEVLNHLFEYNHISDGCCLFFDDWNCNRSSPRFGQRRAWRECVEKYHVEFSVGGDYAVLGHRFTVHIG
jgi:hypothetical protein